MPVSSQNAHRALHIGKLWTIREGNGKGDYYLRITNLLKQNFFLQTSKILIHLNSVWEFNKISAKLMLFY